MKKKSSGLLINTLLCLTETTLPRRLSSSTTIQYDSAIPCSESPTAINAVRKNLEALECHPDKNCDISITMQGKKCSLDNRVRKAFIMEF